MGTLLVTGGAGFIGSNFVRLVLERGEDRVVVLDKLTYAGNLESLAAVTDNPAYAFVKADIADRSALESVFQQQPLTAVVNFAAESHVDRSIDGPDAFVQTNLVGTFQLLEVTRQHVAGLPEAQRSAFRFLHVSTDEVYGSLGEAGAFREDTAYAPNSPYSATKAGADHLVRAYSRTYRLPALITNCSNNYGPYQHPEKMIPLMVLNAIEGRPLPIYGDGLHVRDWLFVEDHCQGILEVLAKGRVGEKYNLGGDSERANIEIVDTLCAELERLRPAAGNRALASRGLDSYAALKTFVTDRPGHDRRYAIDASKVRREIGWRPRFDLRGGLARTVRWYLDHREWCDAVQAGEDARRRLGLTPDPD